jgi:uncharacterized protein (DUF305 family)
VNKKTRRFAVLLVLISAVMMAAWRQDSQTHQKSTADPNWSELTAGMDKMHAAMASIEPSGDADVDFVKLMLPHHQAAVDMAKTELVFAKDPQMRRLAQEIITDQQSEIQLMQLWLKRHQPGSQKSN